MGVYISQDLIGLAGGNPTLYGYVYNSNNWVDTLGLTSGEVTVYLSDFEGYQKHFGIDTGDFMSDLNMIGDDFAHIVKDSDTYEFNKKITLEVPNIEAAKAMQLKEIARGKFPYDAMGDGCLTHVARVLEAGGVDIDSSNFRNQYRFMSNQNWTCI